MNDKIADAKPFGARGFVNGETLHSRWAATQQPFGKRETPPKGRGCAPQRAAKVPEFRTAEVIDFEVGGLGENVLNRRIEMAKRHINTHEYPQQKAAALTMMEELEAELKRR